MGIIVKNLTFLFRFLKYFTPILALIYLILWLSQVLAPNLFKTFDKIFCFIPNIFNKLIYTEADIFGQDIPMGYVHAACLMVLIAFLALKLLAYFERINKVYENETVQKKLAAQRKIKKQKEEARKNNIYKREAFFGLFEFQLEYFNVYGKNPSDLEKLKIEYSKMIVDKLKTKYKEVKFAIKDKVYFFSDNFACFGPITKDFIRLFSVFLQIGKKKSIKTGMLFSYWADGKNANPKGILKILSKINELGYLNKIILSSGVYFRSREEENGKCFEVVPMGTSKLTDVYGKDEDIDIDLYAITKTK